MAIPNSEAALPGYVANFAAKLVAAPTVYATTAPAATAFELLANDYQAAQVALVAAREAGVRSEPLRDARDAAKAAMLPTLRSFYGTIQKNINISAQAKTEIGVKNPKTTVSTVLAPTLRPNTTVTAVFDRTVSMVIEDPTVGVRRSRPKGATQTLVYYFAGENYSSDPNTWQFAGVSTERKYSFTVPGTVAAGTRVWVCAAYTNKRGDSGPVSVPVSIAVQGTGGSTTLETELKIAA